MDRTQQFLDAEEKAKELIETLATLTEEIESYSEAKEELSDVKEKLTALISSLKKSIDDNRTFIKLLKDLDMNEILLRINKLDLKVSEQSDNITESLDEANSKQNKMLKEHITNIIQQINTNYSTLIKYQKESNEATKATIDNNILKLAQQQAREHKTLSESQLEQNKKVTELIQRNYEQSIKAQQDNMRTMKRWMDYVVIVAVLSLIVGVIGMLF